MFLAEPIAAPLEVSDVIPNHARVYRIHNAPSTKACPWTAPDRWGEVGSALDAVLCAEI